MVPTSPVPAESTASQPDADREEPPADTRDDAGSPAPTTPTRSRRWPVGPRLLVALLVVAAPAYFVWDYAQGAFGDEPTGAPAPADRPSSESDDVTDSGADDVELPDFTDGEVVGSWDTAAAAQSEQSDGTPVDATNARGAAVTSAGVDGRDSAEGVVSVSDVAALDPPDGRLVGTSAPEESEPVVVPAEPSGEVTVITLPAATEPEPEPESEVDDTVDASADGPSIEITTRIEPCRFSARCLIAGFVLEGFDDQPAEFVCEFGSGSRFAFPLAASSVDFACATGQLGDSITIEAGGVRSETLVHS